MFVANRAGSFNPSTPHLAHNPPVGASNTPTLVDWMMDMPQGGMSPTGVVVLVTAAILRTASAEFVGQACRVNKSTVARSVKDGVQRGWLIVQHGGLGRGHVHNYIAHHADHGAVEYSFDIERWRASYRASHPLLFREADTEHDPSCQHIRNAVLALTDGHCAYCDIAIASIAEMHVEHVVAKVHGGPNNIANYAPACRACNLSKSDGHAITFIRRVRGGTHYAT